MIDRFKSGFRPSTATSYQEEDSHDATALSANASLAWATRAREAFQAKGFPPPAALDGAARATRGDGRGVLDRGGRHDELAGSQELEQQSHSRGGGRRYDQ